MWVSSAVHMFSRAAAVRMTSPRRSQQDGATLPPGSGYETKCPARRRATQAALAAAMGWLGC